jgi:hypothetical protein
LLYFLFQDVVFVTTIQREIFVSVVYLVTMVTLVKEQLMTVSPVLVPMVDRVYSFPRVMRSVHSVEKGREVCGLIDLVLFYGV